MKNWNIRKKMIPIYLTMTVFTFLLFFAALFIMKALDGMAPGEGSKLINSFIIGFPGYIVIYLAVTYLFGRLVAVQVAFPARALVEAAHKVAEGDVNVQLDHNTTDELGELTTSFQEMVEAIRHQAETLQTIAGGDYTATLSLRGANDVMNKAIIDMLDNSNRLVSEIRTASEQVANGAHQIANGAQTLATGSTQQAASIQEFSATMEGVKHQSENNAEASQKTLAVTNQAGSKMQESMEAMEQVATAMQLIDESSEQITKVIKVIEDIAFQTNILALNAAVEAARAGEHGKGFAVVADEVRNLASKSADAAKETTILIEDSRLRVSEGTAVVEKASGALSHVSELASQTVDLVAKISSDSNEQSHSINELNAGIDQIAMVVQANSATAEESAASAQEMNAQAEMLKRTVASFRLKGDALPAYGQAPQLPPANMF